MKPLSVQSMYSYKFIFVNSSKIHETYQRM